MFIIKLRLLIGLLELAIEFGESKLERYCKTKLNMEWERQNSFIYSIMEKYNKEVTVYKSLLMLNFMFVCTHK